MTPHSSQTKRDFIELLKGRLKAEFTGRACVRSGAESVVVLAKDSAFKCYAKSQFDGTGLYASSREIAVLSNLGGFASDSLHLPRLKSCQKFARPFSWNERSFVCVVEQSRMGDAEPSFEIAEPEKLGRAIGEFHTLLELRPHLVRNGENFIARGREALRPQKNSEAVIPPEIARKLICVLDKTIAGEKLHGIHGDLHHHNVIVDRGAFCLLDMTMLGMSPRAHDLAEFVDDSEILRAMFKGYAAITGVKLSKAQTIGLAALNHATRAISEAEHGRHKDASWYVDQLRAALS